MLVVGAGVSGLTTAMCLVESGFRVTVLAEKRAEFTPSVVAGALWEWPPAVCGHHADLKSLQRSKNWSAVSYRRFQQLAAQPETGVRMVGANFYFKASIDDCPRERVKMDEASRHVQNFERSAELIERNGVSRESGVCDAYTYLAPLIQTDVYMEWLRGRLVSSGCRFEERRLTRPLNETQQSMRAEHNVCAIVNCSGLGSIELACDTMQPLRGALIRVVNDGSAFPKLTTAHCLAHDENGANQQMVYIIPRGDDRLLLGGIAELGEWNTEINRENYEPIRNILKRCRDFLPSLRSAEVDEQDPLRVGLRPYRRENVRLEQDEEGRVFHNYGHGGSGFTFSWGCGSEVVNLIRACL